VSPARRGARLPGQPPEPYCERCGASVDVADIGPWVGMCHCPECDIFACRWCWSEAGEACPECGAVFAGAAVGAVGVGAGVAAAGGATAGAMGVGPGPVPPEESSPGSAPSVAAVTTPEPTAVGVAGAMAVTPSGGPDGATGSQPEGIRPWTSPRRPAGIGVVALVFVALAVIVGDPFRSASDNVLFPTSSPRAGATGAVAVAETSTADPTGTPAAPSLTDPTASGTPTAAPTPRTATSTRRPASTPLARTGSAATPRPPKVPATPRPTPIRTPKPTPAPTPRPTPSCRTVPDVVGQTIAKARAAWTAAGFTGSFNAPKGPANRKVATQSQPAGACLPPGTSITVTV
jgi:hypothetical protein